MVLKAAQAKGVVLDEDSVKFAVDVLAQTPEAAVEEASAGIAAQAQSVRKAGRALATLEPSKRANIIRRLADLLHEREADIMKVVPPLLVL